MRIADEGKGDGFCFSRGASGWERRAERERGGGAEELTTGELDMRHTVAL
jgi:hypothetical protein